MPKKTQGKWKSQTSPKKTPSKSPAKITSKPVVKIKLSPKWKSRISWDDCDIEDGGKTGQGYAEVRVGIGFSTQSGANLLDFVEYDSASKAFRLSGFTVIPEYFQFTAQLDNELDIVNKRLLLVHERVHYAISRYAAAELVESLNRLIFKSQNPSADQSKAELDIANKAVKELQKWRNKAKDWNKKYDEQTRPGVQGHGYGEIKGEPQLTWTQALRRRKSSGIESTDVQIVQEFITETKKAKKQKRKRKSRFKKLEQDKDQRPRRRRRKRRRKKK